MPPEIVVFALAGAGLIAHTIAQHRALMQTRNRLHLCREFASTLADERHALSEANATLKVALLHKVEDLETAMDFVTLASAEIRAKDAQLAVKQPSITITDSRGIIAPSKADLN